MPKPTPITNYPFFFKLLVTVLASSLVGFCDRASGFEVSFLPFYTLVVGLSAWFFSIRWAIFAGVLCAAASIYVQVSGTFVYSRWWIPHLNGFSRLVVWVFVAYAVRYMRRTVDLARQKIEAFSRPIPVCTQCHRLNDIDDGWLTVEAFLEEYTASKPSPKVCPDCARQLFVGRS
jgi:hypothetical protein